MVNADIRQSLLRFVENLEATDDDGTSSRLAGARARVLIYQLPLSVMLVILIGAVAVFRTPTLSEPWFQASLLMHAFILAFCLAMPWAKMPRWAPKVVPLLDMVALGFTRESDLEALTSVGLLFVYPVVWLSLGGLTTGVLLTLLGTALGTMVPLAVIRGEFLPDILVRPLLLPFVLVGISLSVNTSWILLRLRRQALQNTEAELRRLLLESKHREQLLRTVVDTFDAGVLVLDADGNPLLMNSKQHAYFSGDSEAAGDVEIMPMLGADKATPVDPEAHPVRRAREGETFFNQLVWGLRGTRKVPLSASARAMRDEEGQLNGSVLIFTDLSAVVAQAAKREHFFRTAAHELRTPLTPLLGYLELLRESSAGASQEVRAYAEAAHGGGKRLSKAVDELLAAANDQWFSMRANADMAEIVADAVANAKPAMTANGVNCELDVSAPLPVSVDERQIADILDGLLGNAIRFSPGGGTVTISTELQRGQVTVAITDTGIGMSEQERTRAFDSFFGRTVQPTSTLPGVGLGLHAARSIVEGHGGSMSLVSQRGQGTTVRLSLPAAAHGRLRLVDTRP